eukprot:3844288-Pleurochrysis_carterae.AAC.2
MKGRNSTEEGGERSHTFTRIEKAVHGGTEARTETERMTRDSIGASVKEGAEPEVATGQGRGLT